jgi:putative membrane protein
VKEAASGGTSEVELGELAKLRSTTDTVRTFGDRMIKDHIRANTELREIATQKGASMPAQLSQSDQSSIESLQDLSGTAFDKAYASTMVKDQKNSVKEFMDASEDLKDPDLKAFAQRTAPTLEEHLRMAEEMENSLKH